LNDVNYGEGRTVLFVSHNIDAISNLCKNALVLQNGKVECIGNVNSSVEYYLNNNFKSFDRAANENSVQINRPKITHYSIVNKVLVPGQLKFMIGYASPFPLDELNLGVVIKTITGTALFSSNCKLSKCYGNKNNVLNGVGEVCFQNIPIHSGTYCVDLFLGDSVEDYDLITEAITFDFIGLRSTLNNYNKSIIGHTITESEWTLTELQRE
jgi:lipopolysaccharide transport system ATP-binding protein